MLYVAGPRGYHLGVTDRIQIPAEGRPHADILEELASFRQGDADWRNGKTFSLVYFAGDEHLDLLKKAHNLYFSENGLNPIAFKSLRKMESQVVSMAARMLSGGPEVVGTMTTGGTESILLAVKTYRDRARKLKPQITKPEIVAPITAHVALEKAAHYFGLKVRYAKVDETYGASVASMRSLIGPNTVMLVASAPQYPQGVIDPIVEIGALAEEKGLPLHVDACIGGFMLPWLEKLGYSVQPFDFRVPGVTSISADVHKFGYAAKGASVILYRTMSYMRHQFFVATDWPGGIYASPSVPGTRGGGAIAAAWAALMGMGEAGYMHHAKRAMQVAEKLRAGIGKIPELHVLGDPAMSLVSYAAKDERTFAIADQLEERGFSVDRQQRPDSIHLTLTSNHEKVIDDYLVALGESVAFVRQNPEVKSKGNAAMYGMMAKVPFRGMVKETVSKVLEQMYAADADPDAAGKLAEEGTLVSTLIGVGHKALSAAEKLTTVARSVLGRKRS